MTVSQPTLPTRLYYQHSGKFSPTGIVMALTAGVITAVIAAFAYSYLVLFVPFIYLNLLATIGFGFIMGASTGWAAKLGKVRSAGLTFILALVVTAFGFWLCWAVWVNGVIDRWYEDADEVSLMDFVKDPQKLWVGVQAINSHGTWTPGKNSKDPVKGQGLTAIWIIEGGIIFFMGLVGAGMFAKAEMFCESCKQWCGKATVHGTTAPGDEKEARARLESHDLRYLEALPPQTDPLVSWSVQTEVCPLCSNLNALTVFSHKTTVNKKGESSNVNKPVVKRLLMSNDETVYITAMMAHRTAAQIAAAQAAPPAPGHEASDDRVEE